MANFNSLIFILLHLSCFIIFYTARRRPKPPRKPPSLTNLNRRKPISSSWSFIKRIFSSKPDPLHSYIFHQIPSATSSTRSTSIIQPDDHLTARPGSVRESDHFHIRNEIDQIHPCPNCSEIFQTPGSLEHHQFIKHTVCEMSDDDPGTNVIRMIFVSGWPGEPPRIHRVIKIYNSPKMVTRFEEYRESVKLKAARRGGPRRDEQCIANGNEMLRFHSTTFICDLGQNGNSTICTHQYCSVCGIIGSGFSPKLDGISTLPNGWRGHVAIPEDIEEEFQFMNMKRAMLVCRVIAGQVGCDPGMSDKDDTGWV